MIKLIATDMDGTFLDDNGQFEMERLKKVLSAFKEKGILFAAASGRGMLSLQKLFADVRDQIVFIAENGSLVEYKGEVLYEATMPKTFYTNVFEQLKACPYVDVNQVLLTGKKASYVLDTVDPSYLYFSRHYNENIQQVSHFSEITDDIFKFTTNFPEDLVEAGEVWVNEHIVGVKAMTTGFQSIDIVLDYVDKGVAISAIAEKLQIDLADSMVFGDNLNDLHMMQVAGHSIAPENARPEILSVATERIGHHASQSVMTYMEEMVNEY